MKLTCIGLLFFFTCEEAAPPPPAVLCETVAVWSKPFQESLHDEYARLKPEGAARRVIREHIQLRDRARACGSAKD